MIFLPASYSLTVPETDCVSVFSVTPGSVCLVVVSTAFFSGVWATACDCGQEAETDSRDSVILFMMLNLSKSGPKLARMPDHQRMPSAEVTGRRRKGDDPVSPARASNR